MAQDLRKQIYTQVQLGKTDNDIQHFMVARYGNFVLFKPPVQKSTWALWFGPFILMLIGFIIIARIITRSKRTQLDQGGQ